MPIDLICLDADDTLWHNMRHFQATQDALVAMLEPFADAGIASAALEACEVRNLKLYGYGAKAFTLSKHETAWERGGAVVCVRGRVGYNGGLPTPRPRRRIGPVDIGFPIGQAALSGYGDGAMGVIARRLGASYTLYEVLLGQSQGPRFGSFVAIFGVDRTVGLIERALAGELVAA